LSLHSLNFLLRLQPLSIDITAVLLVIFFYSTAFTCPLATSIFVDQIQFKIVPKNNNKAAALLLAIVISKEQMFILDVSNSK